MVRSGTLRARGVVLGTLLLAMLTAGVVVWPETTADPARPKPATPVPELRGGAEAPVSLDPRALLEHSPITTIRGRCVADETGDPLAGCHVDLTVEGKKMSTVHGSGGQFELRFTIRERLSVRVTVRAPGRVPLAARLTCYPGDRQQLGTLALRAGPTVHGILRDTDGQPVAGARVRLSAGLSPPVGPLFEREPPPVSTRSDGTFAFGWPMGEGTYRVWLTDAPPLTSGRTVQVVANRSTMLLELTCAASTLVDEIRGVALDPLGRVAADISVEARLRNFLVARATSRADGSFTLFRPERAPRGQPVRLSLLSFKRVQQSSGYRMCKWGTRDVTLMLSAGRRLLVEVVDAASGEPVEEFGVQCIPMTGMQASGDSHERVPGEHPGGRVWIERLRTGPHLVVVHPRGGSGEWSACLPQRIEIGEHDDQRVKVRLHRSQPLRIVVRDPRGRPVAGSEVSMLALERLEHFLPKTHVTELKRLFVRGLTRGPHAILLARGETDARGQVEFRWTPSPACLTVRVEGRHTTFGRDDFVFDTTGQTLAIEVAAGARLHGILYPTSHLRWVHAASPGQRRRIEYLERQGNAAGIALARRFFIGRLVLIEVGGEGRRVPWRKRKWIPIDDDGGFAVDGVPPGTWRIYLQRATPRRVFEELASPLAEVKLVDRETRSLRLDLRGWIEPAFVAGELRGDGRPRPRTAVQLVYTTREGGRRIATRTHTDDSGSFRFEPVAPRTYTLRAIVGERRVPVGAELTVGPGQEYSGVFTLDTARVGLRLRAADGKTPRPFESVVLRCVGGATLRGKTDAAGELLLDHVPVGEYRGRDFDSPVLVIPAKSRLWFTLRR